MPNLLSERVGSLVFPEKPKHVLPQECIINQPNHACPLLPVTEVAVAKKSGDNSNVKTEPETAHFPVATSRKEKHERMAAAVSDQKKPQEKRVPVAQTAKGDPHRHRLIQ